MKAVGSEKIANPNDKLKRIVELSGSVKLNENYKNRGLITNVLHEAKASNGDVYGIVQEGKHVYIKIKNGDSFDYVHGKTNINEHSYRSYADALKNLNLMFRDINSNSGHSKNINVFKKKI